jgi:cell division protein FtsQ
MPAVKAATDKNFRRARVRPGAHRPSWGASIPWRACRWGMATILAVYAAYRGGALILHAPGLQVRRITVHGNVRLSSGEVGTIVDGLRGANILTADLPAYRRRLMASPWVADAALRRVLPSTVEVFVSERRPMGLCRIGSALYLVDPHGTLIDDFGPQYAEFDLPVIDGLVRAPGPEATIDEGRAELAARVIDALAPRQDLARRLSQIDVSDVHDAIVILDQDTALLHLGDDKFLERLQSYVDLAPALRQRVPNIEYVDLRFDERVYVRPVSASTSGRQP